MAIQLYRPTRQTKKASDVLFDEPETLTQKRNKVMDVLFGNQPSSYYNVGQDDGTEQGESESSEAEQSNAMHDDEPEPKQDQQEADEPPTYHPPSNIQKARTDLINSMMEGKVNPESTQINQPDRPEYDQEREDKLRHLAKMNAIAQGITAVSQAIGAATNSDYAAAPIQSGTGMEAFNMLANMKQDYRNRLRNYDKQVFNINRYNQKARLKAEGMNHTIDQNAARQRLSFLQADEQTAQQLQQARAELQQKRQQAQNEQRGKKFDALVEEGQRLITQGKVQAAAQAFHQAGLGQATIMTILKQHAHDMGGGKRKDYDPAIQNMVNAYRDLQEKVGADDYDKITGKPATPDARQLEHLRSKIPTQALYNPQYGYGKENPTENNDDNTETGTSKTGNHSGSQEGVNTVLGWQKGGDDISQAAKTPSNTTDTNHPPYKQTSYPPAGDEKPEPHADANRKQDQPQLQDLNHQQLSELQNHLRDQFNQLKDIPRDQISRDQYEKMLDLRDKIKSVQNLMYSASRGESNFRKEFAKQWPQDWQHIKEFFAGPTDEQIQKRREQARKRQYQQYIHGQ
jgi:hypothetical protein